MFFSCLLHIASFVALMLLRAFLGPLLVPTWPLQGRFWAQNLNPKRVQNWNPQMDPIDSAEIRNFFNNLEGLAGAFHVILLPCLHFVRTSLRFRPFFGGWGSFGRPSTALPTSLTNPLASSTFLFVLGHIRQTTLTTTISPAFSPERPGLDP